MWRTHQNKSPWDFFCKFRCLSMLVCLFINLLHSDSMNMFSFISLMKRSTFWAGHLLPSSIFVYFPPNRLPIPLLSLSHFQHWTCSFCRGLLCLCSASPKSIDCPHRLMLFLLWHTGHLSLALWPGPTLPSLTQWLLLNFWGRVHIHVTGLTESALHQ